MRQKGDASVLHGLTCYSPPLPSFSELIIKVVRTKSGFQISLCDSEMEMLRHLVDDGLSHSIGLDDDSYQEFWTTEAKAAFARRVEAKGEEGGILWTDEDRRDSIWPSAPPS